MLQDFGQVMNYNLWTTQFRLQEGVTGEKIIIFFLIISLQLWIYQFIRNVFLNTKKKKKERKIMD